MYQPHTISIITTYKCTAKCEHCCFNCSPSRNEYLNWKYLKKSISDAAQLRTIKIVVFTGGECFMLGDNLFKAIKLASGLGFTTRCVSNGYWASSKEQTEIMIKKLIDVGLTEINFSTGDHHAKYVPVENIIRAVNACCNAGIMTAVNIELFKESKLLCNLKSTFRCFKKKYKNLRVYCGLWISRKNSNMISYPNKFYGCNRMNFTKGCDSILGSISVMPNGIVCACCGLCLNKIPEMILGDIKLESLNDIVVKMMDNEDLIKVALAVEGPEKLLNYVSSNKNSKEKSSFVHPCQSCLQIYKKSKYHKKIQRYCLENAERLYSTYRVANAVGNVINCTDS